MAQLVGRHLAKHGVDGSSPSKGTGLGYRFGPSVRDAYERQLINVSLSHRCFSPSLSPSLPLSLEINKII